MPESIFKITFRPETCNFIEKVALVHVFFCEFFEIFNNTFFTEHLNGRMPLGDCF